MLSEFFINIFLRFTFKDLHFTKIFLGSFENVSGAHVQIFDDDQNDDDRNDVSTTTIIISGDCIFLLTKFV